MDEPLRPPGLAPAPPVPRRVEWWLAVLPVETALLVVLGGFTPLLAASVLLAPPALAVVRFRRLGNPRVAAMLVLAATALFTRLVVTEVFGGVGVL